MALATQKQVGTAVHKHVQVREYVRSLIDGAPPGSAAPSERELVHRFGVARMTVRQALDALVSEGRLERIPGRGTFVARPRLERRTTLLGFTEEMGRRGLKVGSRTLLARVEAAGPGVAKALEVELGTRVIHWQRLRYADDAPMCLSDSYLVEARLPGFLEADAYPSSLYEELGRRGLMPTWGEDSVEADSARSDEAALLGVTAGAPVLRVARRAFAERVAIEVSKATFRADRFTMWVPVSRQGEPGTSRT